jgi:hypothetical protein
MITKINNAEKGRGERAPVHAQLQAGIIFLPQIFLPPFSQLPPVRIPSFCLHLFANDLFCAFSRLPISVRQRRSPFLSLFMKNTNKQLKSPSNMQLTSHVTKMSPYITQSNQMSPVDTKSYAPSTWSATSSNSLSPTSD